MTATEDIKYKELLDCEWAIKSNMLKAQTKYDDMYQKYGKDDKEDLLTELAYEDLKLLREARKTLHKVVRVLRSNDLYTNGD